jgi:hypothetical protein
MGWDGMGWDGMGWDGMGWDGKFLDYYFGQAVGLVKHVQNKIAARETGRRLFREAG